MPLLVFAFVISLCRHSVFSVKEKLPLCFNLLDSLFTFFLSVFYHSSFVFFFFLLIALTGNFCEQFSK